MTPNAYNTENTGCSDPASNVIERISPFEKKPLNGMMPARAREPKSIAFEVTGIGSERPPISRMSLVWTAWMTLPAPRKSRALKNARLKRWYRAALYPAESREGSFAIRYAPAPRPRNMYASWEMVENARTLLMSKFTTAIVAAKIVVKPPIAAITRIAVNGGATRGERGTRKMNAFFAAAAASGLWYQKPINRYEQRPMISQKIRSWRKLSALTVPSIPVAKRLTSA